jgi:hypothetical protein
LRTGSGKDRILVSRIGLELYCYAPGREDDWKVPWDVWIRRRRLRNSIVERKTLRRREGSEEKRSIRWRRGSRTDVYPEGRRSATRNITKSYLHVNIKSNVPFMYLFFVVYEQYNPG